MSYEVAISRLKDVFNGRSSNNELSDFIAARDEVITKYQLLFTSSNIPNIQADDFREFLIFRNNKHWSGLQRMGPQTTADMPALRDALITLIDNDIPMEQRIDQLLPGGKAVVHKLGKAILTPILLICYPDKYGVWNGTSEGAMRQLGIWPTFDKAHTVGQRYVIINDLLLKIADELQIDLWTLDALWWTVLKGILQGEEEIEAEQDEDSDIRFRLEKYLHHFIYDNWYSTDLGKCWDLVEEGGDVMGYGFERITDAGDIDLLAKHKTDPKWLVIELKRGRTSDAAVGQVLRYINWVRLNLAESNDRVEGLIIGGKEDKQLHYSLGELPHVSFMKYEIDFKLIGNIDKED